MVAEFFNDDPGYFQWLKQNPTGYEVCSHRLPLRAAQREIAANWLRVYRREFPG